MVSDQLGLPAGRGLVVQDVVPGSAADKAGLKSNDILLDFAGGPVTDDSPDFVRRVQEAKSGEKIALTVLRKGKKETISVELSDLKRRVDAVPAAGFGAPGARATGARNSSVRIAMNDGGFDIQSTDDTVEYGIKGRMDAGSPTVSEITIKDGDKVVKAESLDKIPAEYREKVQKLLGSVGGGRRRNVD